MEIIGIDLSGPASPEKTAVARFVAASDGLVQESLTVGATDARIAELVGDTDCVIGIDAPLSYCPGGGSRPADRQLRERIIQHGLPAGTVMAPSAPRMAYLTLRGISLTRLLASSRPNARMVEVHPTASLALRGASIAHIRSFKRSASARACLLDWLERQRLKGIEPVASRSDHAIAACAAALAAWKWQQGECVWLHEAEPPIHPFDFAC